MGTNFDEPGNDRDLRRARGRRVISYQVGVSPCVGNDMRVLPKDT